MLSKILSHNSIVSCINYSNRHIFKGFRFLWSQSFNVIHELLARVAIVMSSHPKNLIAGIDITKPILKGHLFKQAHLHQSFNKRYFVLYPKVLVYYDHEHNFLRDLERGTLEVSSDTCMRHSLLDCHLMHTRQFSFCL